METRPIQTIDGDFVDAAATVAQARMELEALPQVYDYDLRQMARAMRIQHSVFLNLLREAGVIA